MSCMDKNAIAERVVRSVVGVHRKIVQCLVFDDGLGKDVTVRYEGLPEKRPAQIEAIKIVKVFADSGYDGSTIRLFVTDADGQNVGSMVVPVETRTFDFVEVGNKWQGKPLPVDELADLEQMQAALKEPQEGMFIQKPPSRRIADIFSRFYAELKTRNAREMPALPKEPTDAMTREEFNHKPNNEGGEGE